MALPEIRFLQIAFLLLTLLYIQCQNNKKKVWPAEEKAIVPEFPAANEAEDPVRLSRELLIVDGHIDLPDRLRSNPQNPAESTTYDFDFPKALAGGLNAAFMAVYIPAGVQHGASKPYALRSIASIERLAEDHPEKFRLIGNSSSLLEFKPEGPILLALGMENGSALEGDLENLSLFYGLGIRYITLTHSRNNEICDSSTDSPARWGGLSPFGRNLIEAMNRHGIMIDLSHASDGTFYQILKLSRSPVIASHSGCRALAPNVVRNLSDDMLCALVPNGGLVMVNFGSYFLNAESHRAWSKIYRMAWGQGMGEDHPAVLAYMDSLQAKIDLYRSVQDVADHIDHVVRIAGIEHVGLGSDFDGLGRGLPKNLKSAADYPKLIAELHKRGYNREQISAVCGGNLMRVWSRVEYLADSENAH